MMIVTSPFTASWFARVGLCALAAILAGSFVLPASAETKMTRFGTFLHVGPGARYAVSDEIPTRTALDVGPCSGDWCEVRYGRASGWVDGRNLVPLADRPAVAPTNCVDFVRSGWPKAGDLERLCLAPAVVPTQASN